MTTPRDQVTLNGGAFGQIARCVDAIGTAEFPGAISLFCARIAAAETVFLTAFFPDQKPVALYGNHTDEADMAALSLYLDVAYLLDPFYPLLREERSNRVAMLKEIAPDDFKRSEYYQQFFKAIRLRDECGLVLHLSEDAALFFSLGVQGRRRIDHMNLKVALPLIAALAGRHWTVLSPERPDGSGRLAAHLEKAFEMFGRSVLSPREGEIVRMILRGHSSKAIARVFDNSPETIKVHRKRIYTKLGVTSQGELLSLFLSSLSKMPPTIQGDPLEYAHS